MSKDVKTVTPVLSQSLRRATVAPITRSVVVEKDGLETDDVPTPPSTPPPIHDELTSDDLIAFYKSGTKGKRELHKYYNLWGSGLTPSTSATATPLVINSIATGTSENGRIGQRIRLNHIMCRFRCLWSGTNVSASTAQIQSQLAPPAVRHVIFWDRMPLVAGSNATTEPSCIWSQNVANGTGMGALTLTATLGTLANSWAPWNGNTHGTRYQILYDKVTRPKSLNYSGNSGGVTNSTCANYLNWEHKIDLKDRVITFNQSSATTTIDYRLCMFVIADGQGAGAVDLIHDYSFNLVFQDVSDP